ncbi:NAD(P)-binding protein [Venustampulla echinocandica]|uniref:NAD(P)-binding protein n=1 Tax=Venustampulla echinocandica TaxID=2656787 RepID=A0A370TV89_9HELO|nr:NAD(P)-binding protein [Venustampulla echinocandica]RDL39455.1 NAD(P)-binding protein [Venustampulla echinocandica]
MVFSHHNSAGSVPARTVDGAGYGKVAIITGCASGVGLATTNLFLSHQYEVLGVDVHDIDYSKVNQECQESFHFHRGDLMEEDECNEVVRICVGKYGPKIDVLANVAGVMDAFAAADVYTDKEWDRVMMINLTVPTRMIRAVLPMMKAKGNGSIINVASKAAVSGAAAGVAYTASKHGLLGVTKNTAWRFHEEGIRCNAVLPGAITDTHLKDSLDPANFDADSYGHQAPIHALHSENPTITPNEVANTILFLASDMAKAINGVALPIDKAWGVI